MRVAAPVAAGPARDRRLVALALGQQRRDPRSAPRRRWGGGCRAREAALARGFVLGEDEGIDARDRGRLPPRRASATCSPSRARTSPCWPCWRCRCSAALGIPLRERLLWVLALIAVYVPLAGAGPSIQRAGGDGRGWAAGDPRRPPRLAPLRAGAGGGGDPRDRPRRRRRRRLAAQLRRGARHPPARRAAARERSSRGSATGPWRRALAEGVAVTVAATLATAPLIAFHFETLSTTTLVANVLALPAVAPAMWLGMLQRRAGAGARAAAGAAERPRRAAARLHRPGRRLVRARRAGPSCTSASDGVGLVGRLPRPRPLAAPLASAWRRLAAPAAAASPRPRAAAARAAAAALLRRLGWPGGGGGAAPPARGLRVEVLDVGQGDAILLQPRGAPAVLVDGGPPGDDLAGKLERRRGRPPRGRGRHPRPVRPRRRGRGTARALPGRAAGLRPARPADCSPRPMPPGSEPERVAAGQRAALRRACGCRSSGRRRSCSARRVAGRRPEPAGAGDARPAGATSRMLLTADAEAEAVPLDPGPVDVLKVAHHGSDDAGLGALLDRIRPRLAVISVGDGQPLRPPDAAAPSRPSPQHRRADAAHRPRTATSSSTSAGGSMSRGRMTESKLEEPRSNR